ncbi:quaternary ammonium compound-resistance protein SugE [Geomicrobium sp. JCM 19055]|nr:quaternary ammonium compound-resistance protein SugE [Geomicrobium sp. JCM 19055]
MNKWWLVIIAAFFEVGWATGLKYADSFGTWSLTVIAIVISFWLLVRAATSLPTSTVYAIFVALGTVGTVAVDLLFFLALRLIFGCSSLLLYYSLVLLV